MKLFVTIVCLLLIQYGMGQQISLATPITASKVSGNIVLPALQSITVTTTNNAAIEFSTVDDFSNGKVLHKFYTVVIKSNVPWTVSMAAASDFVGGFLQHTGEAIPANILSIKKSSDNQYVSLASAEQALLQSDNDNIVNTYTFDLKINPAWNYAGGIYNLGVVFTLTAQ